MQEEERRKVVAGAAGSSTEGEAAAAVAVRGELHPEFMVAAREPNGKLL